MNTPSHLSPVAFLLLPLGLDTCVGLRRRSWCLLLGSGPCKGSVAPRQLLGSLHQRTAGCLALPLLEPSTRHVWLPWPLSRQTQDLCLAASKGFLSLLIPSDIWPCFRLWPALLCLCLSLGTADAGTKKSGQLPLAPALGPQGAVRTSCTVTHAAAGAGEGPRICLGKGLQAFCPVSLGPFSFEGLVTFLPP